MLTYLAVAVVLWIFWRLIRNYVVRSPFARIPGPPPSSLIFGNLYDLFSPHSWDAHAEVASYGSVSSVTGILGKKWLYVYDPTALYSILIKDHDSWDMDSWVLDSDHILLGPGLLSVRGDAHRKQRKMLTPVFSIKHLRNMTPVFYGVGHKLVEALSARVGGGTGSIDVMTWMSRAALEMIGLSGMGYSFDPLVEDVADDYANALKEFASLSSAPLVHSLRQFTSITRWLGSRRFWRKALDALPSKTMHHLADVVDTMHAKSIEILEEKKAAAKENGGVGEGKDIMSILLKANMEADDADKLPEDQLIAQMSTILFAAMDTTSSALAHTLQLLSEHPEVQLKLRQELHDASHGEDLDYDTLHDLPYLDAICRETLRMYSPVTVTFREALKDTVLPVSEPIAATDGKMMYEIPVPRGTNTFIAIHACNRNKAIWGEDADEWKPERWLKPMTAELEKATMPGVYSHLMTFLGGNRACIGFKLSQLEMKLILSVLVQNFSFDRGNVPIIWNLSGVGYPSTSLESTKPELWLTVRKL